MGTSRSRQAAARTCACSGWPCVVRSPARSRRSTFPARAANAWRASSAREGWQCMSPAAAIRTLTVVRCTRCAVVGTCVAGSPSGMGEARSTFEVIESTLKNAAAALRDAEVPFALAGSVACWARGAPQSRNDLDFLVREQDAEAGLEALVSVGMRAERPPEGWLLKAWDVGEDGSETLVDLIFGPRGIDSVEGVLDRAEILPVAALDLPVVHLDDVMVMKLHAFDEH